MTVVSEIIFFIRVVYRLKAIQQLLEDRAVSALCLVVERRVDKKVEPMNCELLIIATVVKLRTNGKGGSQ